MRRLILIVFILGLSPMAVADTCLPKLDLKSFEQILNNTRETFFPELKNENIGITTFTSDAYFLQVQPVFKTLVGKRSARKYSVQLNLKLLDCPPSEEVLEAILVHELEHVKDYTKWSTAKLLKHGARYSSSFKFRAAYERETDHKTLEKGLHVGLAGYRTWIYQWLNPKELAQKRRLYLTPEEILGH